MTPTKYSTARPRQSPRWSHRRPRRDEPQYLPCPPYPAWRTYFDTDLPHRPVSVFAVSADTAAVAGLIGPDLGPLRGGRLIFCGHHIVPFSSPPLVPARPILKRSFCSSACGQAVVGGGLRSSAAAPCANIRRTRAAASMQATSPLACRWSRCNGPIAEAARLRIRVTGGRRFTC